MESDSDDDDMFNEDDIIDITCPDGARYDNESAQWSLNEKTPPIWTKYTAGMEEYWPIKSPEQAFRLKKRSYVFIL